MSMYRYDYITKIILLLITFSHTLPSNFYSESDINKTFDFYKTKYNKAYKSIDEENQARSNFVKNFGLLDDYNEKNTDKEVVYVLNKFADLDTEQLERQYSITISPFDNLRSQGLRNDDKKVTIDETKFYDLDNAKDLYKEFLTEHNKSYDKKYERKVHYYKFVQTLVKINEQRLQGINATVDENADVLEEPYEYFY
ncbi:hypothetical protein K1T71_007283 [Dendrolimus kikuchii]|uniref:Uncharacterized protein n=1 Tax=Dendrolimus kikuchii TaxID=765133 RepID=A0ACC1D005_9NEOP|nr:hypothetical protein K1T71_007283 [Dendrolimus kikuchii]